MRPVVVEAVDIKRPRGRYIRLQNVRRNEAALTFIKATHTLARLSIESGMAYVLYVGTAKRTDRRGALAGAIVAGESLIFTANRRDRTSRSVPSPRTANSPSKPSLTADIACHATVKLSPSATKRRYLGHASQVSRRAIPGRRGHDFSPCHIHR
jgi:hypothetical protein